ncbi:hypothetical protein E2562_012950, partial [Oryza meyeriana var. granulata]
MARWDEKNAKVRTDAYEKDRLDGGEVIDAYGYIANIANDNVGVITTFQSNLICDEFGDFDSRLDYPWVTQVGKICVMRQM